MFYRLRRLAWAVRTDREFRVLGWWPGTFFTRFYRGRLRDHLPGRGPLVRPVALRHPVTGDRNVLWMRFGPGMSDWLVLRGVWIHQDYWHATVRAARSILDVGANIGAAAVWFSRIAPGAQIACVEPDPRNLPLLRRNLAGNAVNAAVFECAVAAGRGEARLGVGLDTGCSALAGTGCHVYSESVSVPTRTVPDILDELGWARVDLIKMDIEGAEREVLAGCASWLDRVGAVVLEVHPNTSPQEIGSFVSPLGWRIERLGRIAEPTYRLARCDAAASGR